MDINCFCNFKTALYSSAVVMKGFTSTRKLFLTEVITVKLKAGILLYASIHIPPLTFIIEALHLSGSPFVALLHYLSSLWQAFMTCCVNMATPIHFIDGKCHNKVIKSREKP